MSEDDRAAKAARARAMLKKRQAQKAADHGGAPSPTRVGSPIPRTASPALSPSRTSTPAPSEPPAAPTPPLEEKPPEGNLADLFSKTSNHDASDADSWLSGLTRVDSIPSPAVVSPPLHHPAQPPTSPLAAAPEREDLRALIRDQRRAIEALEAEKTALSSQLDNLSQVESKSRHTHELFQAERAKTEELERAVQVLRSHSEELAQELQRQQHVISSLEAENKTLASLTEELKVALTKAEQAEQALVTERQNSTRLQEQVQGLDQSVHEYTERLEQQQQTISLLVSEKNSLSAAVERLEHAESALRETEQQLESERAQNAQLRGRVLHLEETAQASETQITSLVATERELTDKSRDQEREIHLLNGRVDELQAQSAEHLRKARELEEQIESDDRAERLEETLKNTQDRADELEFQLSKLLQAHAEGEAKRDELAQQLQLKAQAEADWQARHAESEEQHAVTKEQLTAVVSERDALLEARTALQTELEEGKNAGTELQQKLAALSSELSLNARQLKQVQAELRVATARAEDAEKTQKELQAEGIGLMRSLDEMRPKIVELTDAKLLLSENADSLQKTIQARDADIAQLESELDELRQQKESAEHERDRLAAALAADRTTQAKDASELQRAYAELQAEHAAAQKGVQDLEEERNKLRQLSNSNVEEIRRLTDSLQAQTTHAAALRAELAEQAQAQAEGADFLARAQADMEALRAELAQKDDELERLREGDGDGDGAGEGSSQSLDGEMLNALRQQHALELSAAQSQVRARETALFTAEAQVHAFQRQVAALEDELALLRSHPLQRPSSRGPLPHQLPHRTSSRTVDRSDDLRRASFGSHRAPTSSSLAASAPASAFEGLSPETRHKRKVSLSMLKARIDSEVAASSHHPRSVSSPARRPTPLPAVVEPPSQPATPPPVQQQKRPVFMDEAHVFWCHACQGDLVVL